MVPFTFFAHQGPLLPLARRWPRVCDGVALIVGSMAPDMAYALDGSRFHVRAHGFPGVLTFCVPVTVLVSYLVVRALAPVVPDHLPDMGEFQLTELRGLAAHRFRLVALVVGALLGALSHVALDSFTHEWGWFAQNISWYSKPLGDRLWLHPQWTLFRIVQYIGHVGGSALCVYLLWLYGRRRWMSARAALVEPVTTSMRTQPMLWGPTVTGALAGIGWTTVDSAGVASDVLPVAGVVFAGLCVGALAVGQTRQALGYATER